MGVGITHSTEGLMKGVAVPILLPLLSQDKLTLEL